MSSTSKEKIDVKQAIIEISNSRIRIEAEQEHIKEIKKRLKDEHGIDNSMIGILSNLYHKQNFEDYKAGTDEIIEKYEELFS
jgi:hypothetical protein